MKYRCVPERKSKLAPILSLILVAAGLLLFTLGSRLATAYIVVWQAAAFLLIAVAVMLLGRYWMKSYTYEIAEAEDGYEFSVIETGARQNLTVARLSMASLEDIVPETEENKPKIAEKRKGRKVYNYCVEMVPTDAVTVFFADRIAIRFSPDEEMLDLMRRIREQLPMPEFPAEE